MSYSLVSGRPRRVVDFSSPVDLRTLDPSKQCCRAIRADVAGTITIIDDTGTTVSAIPFAAGEMQAIKAREISSVASITGVTVYF